MKRLVLTLLLAVLAVFTFGCAGKEKVTVRVGSLKGPTTMGLVNLMNASEEGDTGLQYVFTMAADPSEITAKVVSGDLDIALIPANAASVLYNKTNGEVSVIAVNTLGVLDCVTGDEGVKSFKDLDGKTILSTGQGATPEYAINYLKEAYGTTDLKVQYLSEATEVAARLAEDPTLTAILPEPFATAVTLKNENLSIAFSLTDEWNGTGADSKLITGVTIVRNEFLRNNKAAVDEFLEDANRSVEEAGEDVSGTASLIVKYGILENEKPAELALPRCNIVCITGDEMKGSLSGYLQTLYDAAAESVGGKLPGDDFYYIP